MVAWIERKDAPSGKDYKWLSWAVEGAEIFSTCGKRQYMAVIVDSSGHVVSTGYNGGPPGAPHCIDGGCERFKENSSPGSSYDNCIAVHAEQNAIIRADGAKMRGATLYVNGPPCYSCGKMIANAGIDRVVYNIDYAYGVGGWEETEAQLNDWGVTTVFVDLDY